MEYKVIQLGDLLNVIPKLVDEIGIHNLGELVYKGFVKDVPYEYINYYVEKVMIIEERIDIYVSSSYGSQK
jgi:hypothetical protein